MEKLPKVGDEVDYNGEPTTITNISGSDVTLSNEQIVNISKLSLAASPFSSSESPITQNPSSSSTDTREASSIGGKISEKRKNNQLLALLAATSFIDNDNNELDNPENIGGKTKRRKRKSNTRKKPHSLKKRIR
jgi:hypothetical protein